MYRNAKYDGIMLKDDGSSKHGTDGVRLWCYKNQ